ncbi:hypothetical protein BDV19DRAFT_289759 [Aspergillus venezuelensis]
MNDLQFVCIGRSALAGRCRPRHADDVVNKATAKIVHTLGNSVKKMPTSRTKACANIQAGGNLQHSFLAEIYMNTTLWRAVRPPKKISSLPMPNKPTTKKEIVKKGVASPPQPKPMDAQKRAPSPAIDCKGKRRTRPHDHSPEPGTEGNPREK